MSGGLWRSRCSPSMASAAARADAESPDGDLHLIHHDEKILGRAPEWTAHVIPERLPAQIHERFRLGQDYWLPRDLGTCGQRAALAVPDFHSKVVGDPIDRQKTEVMRRELILDSRISQTDNQFHEVSSWLLAPSQ